MTRVAPHAGAWIETSEETGKIYSFSVAPHAGAWIETRKVGLYLGLYASPPMRGRGLKHIRIVCIYISYWSPPMRGRGLKLWSQVNTKSSILVAPHAGAWIETEPYPQEST